MTYKIKYRSEDEMKDSGIEWLGKIPEDWKVTRMKYISNLIMGQSPDSNEVNQEGIGTPFLQGKAEFGNIYPKAINYCKRPKKISRVEDTLISVRAPVGELNISDINYCIGRGLASIKSNINNKYLYYSFVTYKDALISYSTGSTFLAVSINQVENLASLELDSINQLKIANFLDFKTSKFDSIISKKENLIEKLEEAKKSLISEVVTGKVKIIDGELVKREAFEMKENGIEWLGMIPKDWEVTKIKYISKLNNKTLSNNARKNLEMLYIDIGSVDNTGNINEVQELIFQDAPSRARRIVSHEDSILSTVRTYLKAIAYIDSRYDGFICSTGFAVFTPIKTRINPKYFYYIINSEEYINQIVCRSTGVSYPAINAIEISNLTFLLPKLLEQDCIVKILEDKLNGINSIITKTKLQIKKLKQAKQSLISECVTGKIDLRDWEIREI